MRRSIRLAFLAFLGFGIAGSTVLAQDSIPKTDWSQFAAVNTITAEVRKVNGGTVTLRVYYMEAEVVKNPGGNKNNNNNNNRNRNRNNNRNGKNGKNGNQQNPLQRLMQQAQSNQQRVQYHQEHHDYDVAFFADTKVTGKVPASADENGKAMPATPASLTAGMVVQAALVRDKKIALQNFTEKDLTARSIAVLGTNPNFKEDSDKPPAKKK